VSNRLEVPSSLLHEFAELLAKICTEQVFASLSDEVAVGESKTIPEFCRAEKISEAMFHQMVGEGWGPDIMAVGKATRISPEAHAKWRRQREAAASAGVRRALPTSPKPRDQRDRGASSSCSPPSKHSEGGPSS